ncbi:Scavenger receptor cysteine-rich type 1 protein M160 [Geodia barretti]|uniref:Scavenger receptor cysteine-rich type 1 protein M160 n=1 Tax=Geodia barretti TaxID=519541 RepID=A0AA35STM9_GEOBA|nr:Scavenger receptor cysteine-rich type 1 protein M160 [Geodia barretti]
MPSIDHGSTHSRVRRETSSTSARACGIVCAWMEEFKMTSNFTAFLIICLLVGVKSYEECAENGALQLHNANISGVLSICYNSTWRLVCDDEWDTFDAEFVCKQLGLEYEDETPKGCPARGLNVTGSFLMNGVMCLGTEDSLLTCAHSYDVADCIDEEAVVVECKDVCNCAEMAECVNNNGNYSCICKHGYSGNGTFCEDINECVLEIHNCAENAKCINTPGSFSCMCKYGYVGNGTYCESCDPDNSPIGFTGNGTYCEDIDECDLGTHNCDENANCTNVPGSFLCVCNDGYVGIRLVHGNETSGLVEVLRNCEWRSVCDDYWTDHDAKVACGQLGFLPYEVQYWLDDVQCKGDELSLFDCPHKDTHNCGRRERAGVHCLGKDDVEIGLVENTTLYSGIIDLKIRNESRSVCHDQWTDEDAQVACRSMGLPFTDTAITSFHYHFDIDINQVHYWLDDIQCTGEENGLMDCEHERLGVHNCAQHEIAAVIYYAIGAVATVEVGDICGLIEFDLEGNGTITVEVDILGLKDIDNPCDTDIRLCGDNAMCMGSDGRYTCTCITGYSGNGTYCYDMDECELKMDNCSAYAFCTNTPGCYSCTCKEGYIGDGISCSRGCEDGEIHLIEMVGVNERLVEICYNSTWGLVCDDQWGANDNNVQVVCKQFCFESGEKGKICPNVRDGIFWLDEVNCTGDEGRLDNCAHNNIGEHDCTLAEAVTVICSNIDECAMNVSCTENSTCTNTEGSFYCMCNPGYFFGEEQTCRDKDECECGLDDCDENANCTNTEGSYICTCREGYCGDGRYCTVSDANMGIRLVHGNETSGLVEVLRNCEWRSVCDDYWTDDDAMVACRQLGLLPYAVCSSLAEQ